MGKKNCWEVLKCERQQGGAKVSELGECPASSCFEAHGINNGINGGRACWAIAETFCQGEIQGVFSDKIIGCLECVFFKMVEKEEKDQFDLSNTVKTNSNDNILLKIKKKLKNK